MGVYSDSEDNYSSPQSGQLESAQGEEDAREKPIVRDYRPPVSIIVDGESMKFRKRVGNSKYFYCPVKGSASCVLNMDTGFIKRIKVQHTQGD